MTAYELSKLKDWFSVYTSSFFTSDEEDNRNLRLKIEHTHHVCENIIRIARALVLSAKDLCLAEAIALFHDIGRFPQYDTYRTFEDSRSVNHGVLGAETLSQSGMLRGLPRRESSLILKAVRFHNVFALPAMDDGQIRFFVKLIRDADKLDILRVFIDYYESPVEQRASATAFGLPDTPEYSKEVLARLRQREKVSYASLKTLNDFKLMNLSWTYALHFAASYRLLQERGYVERIIDHLPNEEEITDVVGLLRRTAMGRIESDGG